MMSLLSLYLKDSFLLMCAPAGLALSSDVMSSAAGAGGDTAWGSWLLLGRGGGGECGENEAPGPGIERTGWDADLTCTGCGSCSAAATFTGELGMLPPPAACLLIRGVTWPRVKLVSVSPPCWRPRLPCEPPAPAPHSCEDADCLMAGPRGSVPADTAEWCEVTLPGRGGGGSLCHCARLCSRPAAAATEKSSAVSVRDTSAAVST